MQINHVTLKKLRKERGYSQEELAGAAKVSKRTIAEIESGKKTVGTRGSTVKLLAAALRVEPEVLGQEPESEVVKEVEFRKSGLRFARLPLKSETILAYDLVAEQYGVDMTQIIHAAPLLFTLLAEMSLTERLRRAEKTQAAFDAANETLPDYLGGRGWDDTFWAEKQSIGARELFYSRGSEDRVDYFQEDRNPFSDFLIQLVGNELGSDNDAINPEEVHFYPDGFWNYVSLFETYRKNLAGGSGRADYALSHGYTRIGQIPEELRGEEKEVVSKRVKWLEAKVPDEDWDEYEDRMRPIRMRVAEMINESLSEGDTEDA